MNLSKKLPAVLICTVIVMLSPLPRPTVAEQSELEVTESTQPELQSDSEDRALNCPSNISTLQQSRNEPIEDFFVREEGYGYVYHGYGGRVLVPSAYVKAKLSCHGGNCSLKIIRNIDNSITEYSIPIKDRDQVFALHVQELDNPGENRVEPEVIVSFIANKEGYNCYNLVYRYYGSSRGYKVGYKESWHTILTSNNEVENHAIESSNNEVKNRAKAIAVKINRRNMLERGWKTEGTGVIIARDGGTYYVLTAKHVVKEKKSYQIEAPDGKIYMVSDSKITKLDGMDLAVLHFDSTENNNCFFMCYYEVARIGHFGKQTGRIYVFGWSKRDKNFKFTNMEMVNPRYRGQEVADSDGRSSVGRDPLDNGYSLLYKANRVEGQTEPGMSGGPILDNSGHLIGIHRAAHAFQGSLGIPSMIIFNQLPSNIRGLMQLSDAFAAEIPQ